MQVAQQGTSILVGIDFSEDCIRALLRAVTIADPLQARLELVHVFEWPGRDRVRDGAASWPSVLAQAQAALPRLNQICADFVADRVAADIHVLLGDPASGLLQVADRIGAPLIVLGAQGRSARLRSTVGSTAERVCSRSSVPVLVVPRPERSLEPVLHVMPQGASSVERWHSPE